MRILFKHAAATLQMLVEQGIPCDHPDGLGLSVIADQFIDRAEEVMQTIPHEGSYRILTNDEVLEMDFFAAIKADLESDTPLSLDMDIAREVHMRNIRQARVKAFQDLGFPFKLAPELESALIPEETRNKLIALRDIPEVFDLTAAMTLQELRSLWPAVLKG